MELQEALGIARSRVAEIEADSPYPLAIISEGYRIEQGWVFYWNTRAYLETQDHRQGLIGPGPLIVLDDGRVLEGGSGQRPADVLRWHGVIVRPQFEVVASWVRAKASRRLIGGDRFPVVVQAGGGGGGDSLSAVLHRMPLKDHWRLKLDSYDTPPAFLQDGAKVSLLEGSQTVASAEVVCRCDRTE